MANYSCLEIFSVVANSAAFYQFIQERQFVGEKGQVLFQQQYQLITAQLQHDELDDAVLNQLEAAFILMTPFMDREQNFNKLMTQVTKLDISYGEIQLETVNENIALVQQWFSLTKVRHSILLLLLLILLLLLFLLLLLLLLLLPPLPPHPSPLPLPFLPASPPPLLPPFIF